MSLHPNYESLPVSTTAISLTAANYAAHRIAVITVENAAIRFRIDGTDPTSSEGHEVEDGGRITLFSADDIFNFRVIRRDASDAILRVSYGDGSESLTITNPASAGSVSVGTVTVDNGTGASAVPVRGADAVDAAATQNPVRVAGRASAAAPADVSADGDVADLWLDPNGSLNVILRDDAGNAVAVAGGTQYNEDSAHVTGDKVTAAGVVRKDTAASLAGTDGDYTMLIVDANGRLHVNAQVASSALPTGAATEAKQDTIIGHVDGLEGLLTTIDADTGAIATDVALIKTAAQLLDDTVYTDDDDWTDGVSKHILVGGLFQSVPQSITDGDVGPILLDGNGRVVTSVASLPALAAGTNNIGDVDVLTLPADPLGTNADAAVTAGGAGSISGKLRQISSDISAIKTSVQLLDDGVSGTEFQVDVVTLPSIPAGTNNIGDVDVLSIAAGNNIIGQMKITDGVEVASVDASNRLEVAVGNTVTVGSHAVTNAGTFAVQVDGAALTALQKIDDPVLVDDAAFTPATSSVMMAGFEADETSTDSVDEGDAGAARMTLDRRQIVVPQGHATGGLSIFRTLDLDETEEEVKASAGTVYGWYFFNNSTSIRYLKFYNATAASVSVGTTTPVMTFPIPAVSSGGIAANMLGGVGIKFDTAITVAVTTGLADADTGAPSANDVILNLWYV